MYFRKTVHCWCVGSSWIHLPVRVFIHCLVTLEMRQAILKFKKVSDIVIVIAGLEFISVTQYSLHFGNVVSAVQNHHLLPVLGLLMTMLLSLRNACNALLSFSDIAQVCLLRLLWP